MALQPRGPICDEGRWELLREGDTQVFQTIRWNFKTPIKADRPILALRHLETQSYVPWGAWDGDFENSAVNERGAGHE